MLHPAAAHFAVVLPLISLVIGLAYLYKPSELMSKVSTRFMVFATVFMIVAFFTGKSEGTEIFPILSDSAQELLKEHKSCGLYLMIAMGIATLIKFFGCFKNIFKVEVVAIVLVALISVGVLYQGKIGGELTYTHGVNVEKHIDGMDCLEDPSDFLDEEEE